VQVNVSWETVEGECECCNAGVCVSVCVCVCVCRRNRVQTCDKVLMKQWRRSGGGVRLPQTGVGFIVAGRFDLVSSRRSEHIIVCMALEQKKT